MTLRNHGEPAGFVGLVAPWSRHLYGEPIGWTWSTSSGSSKGYPTGRRDSLISNPARQCLWSARVTTTHRSPADVDARLSGRLEAVRSVDVDEWQP